MPDGTPACSTNAADMVVLNQKLQYDISAGLGNQIVADNQANARVWNSFNYMVAQNGEAFNVATKFNTLASDQTGVTENQQAVTPIRTGTGDYLAAGAIPANRATDVAAAGVATANQGLADAVANLQNLMLQGIAALQAAVVKAGGAPTTAA